RARLEVVHAAVERPRHPHGSIGRHRHALAEAPRQHGAPLVVERMIEPSRKHRVVSPSRPASGEAARSSGRPPKHRVGPVDEAPGRPWAWVVEALVSRSTSYHAAKNTGGRLRPSRVLVEFASGLKQARDE